MTMCGLTLLPRNVLPTIFLVLMSMNAISLLSRFTIITTDVGSVTLTGAACRPAPAAAIPAARTRAPSPASATFFVIAIIDSLETGLHPNRRDQEAMIRLGGRALELMLQVERQAELPGQLEVVVALDHPLGEPAHDA